VSTNTNAIIIAAGFGSRLAPYTDDTPKCMLDFAGKTLLARQIDAYTACGITDISLVRGYRAERINLPNLTYFENPDYASNNILNSLFYAEPAIRGETICGYSDILFDASVPAALLASEHDISIVVDTDWQHYYKGRVDHPISEAENVVFDQERKVVRVGKNLSLADNVDGEFIGMFKLSERGAALFKEQFHKAKAEYWDKPFQQAAVFQKAYITDMIQMLVDQGHPVHCVTIEQGWKEIDTVEDYEKAVKALQG
jgi:L-glutamine-phosphate cytidylyltransferase